LTRIEAAINGIRQMQDVLTTRLTTFQLDHLAATTRTG
jgi:hypothetical protein